MYLIERSSDAVRFDIANFSAYIELVKIVKPTAMGDETFDWSEIENLARAISSSAVKVRNL